MIIDFKHKKRIQNAQSTQSSCTPEHVQSPKYRGKRKRLKDIHEAYKKLDLKLYVLRRAHAKTSKQRIELQSEANKISVSQDELLSNLENHPVKTLSEALICFDIWQMEAISNKKSYELLPTDKILLRIHQFLLEMNNGRME